MPSYGVVAPLTIVKFINDPRGPVGQAMRAMALETQRTAELLATRDLGRIPGDAPRTGYLRKSFRAQKITGASTWRVRNLAKYFGPIELGARPHTIRATGLSARPAQRQRASLASRGQPKVASGLKNSLYKRKKGKTGPYLQFQARDGRWVKAKQVNHPGNRPYKILSRALFITAQRNLVNVRKVGGRQLP